MSYTGAGATTNAQQSQNNAQSSNTQENNNSTSDSKEASNIPQPGVQNITNPVGSSPINPNPINSNPINNPVSNPISNSNLPIGSIPATTADSIPYTASAAAAAGSYPQIIQNSDIPQIQNPNDPYNQNLTMLQANSQLSSPNTAQNPQNPQNYNPQTGYPAYNGSTTPNGQISAAPTGTGANSTEWNNAGAAAAAAAGEVQFSLFVPKHSTDTAVIN